MMKPEPVRHRKLILVRHGQYENDPERLTKVGRKQATFTATRLASEQKARVFSSDMPRAVETAKIIAGKLEARVTQKEFLREGVLPASKAEEKLWKWNSVERQAALRENRKRADSAFRFFAKRPVKKQETCVVVAHGNVIRFWVCKALGIDERTWTRMQIKQGSITTLEMDSKGNWALLGFSEASHMPHAIALL
jgi:serine/threonine-protein phosphatase PGAM5